MGSAVPKCNKRAGRDNRGHVQRPERFEGKCEALKGHIYNVSRGTHKHHETFQKTTREIAEFIGREFDEGGELRTGLVNLKLPELIEPSPPSDPNTDKVGFEKWKFEFARYRKDSANRKKNEQKAYALVLGQCSPAVCDMIESHPDWHTVNNNSDVISILKLIQSAVVTKNTSKNEVHSYVDAVHAFYSFKQHNNMSHSEYLDRFKDLVEVILQHGGDLGADYDRVNRYLKEELNKDPELITNEDRMKAVEACRERFLAVCLLVKGNKNRVGDLIIDIANEFTRNPTASSYPRTLTKAYDMIINYRPRPQRVIDSYGEGGMMFLADGEGRSEGNRSVGRGSGRNGRTQST